MPDMKMFALFMMMFDGGSGEAPQVQLLDFSASYCQPCKQMEPIIQAMARDGFPVRQIDITEEHELARRFQVDRVPTLVLLVEGKEAKRFVGLTSSEELRREMNNAARKLKSARPAASSPESSRSTDVDSGVMTSGTSDDREDAFLQDLPNGSDDSVASSADPKRPSLAEKLKSWLGRGENAKPTVRGQSPDNDQRKQALLRAFNATVRVKVTGTRTKDQQFVQDVGTGTIVQCGSGEAIVLTCAHLFLGISKSDVKVIIEVFENGKATSYEGSVIAGNHDSDVAILKFATSKSLPWVPLLADAPPNQIGQALMSIGCNGGDDPTLMETKLVAVNRYEGPANLVCEKDPESGRSGGGLFNTNGDLVAICSCADRKRKEGLYMALPAILQLINKSNLGKLLNETSADALAQNGDDVGSMKDDIFGGESDMSATTDEPTVPDKTADSGDVVFDETAEDAGDVTAPPSAPRPEFARPKDKSVARAVDAADEGPSDLEPEVVIEIVDRANGGKKRRVVIPKASPWLLEMLGDDGSMTQPAAVASAARKLTSDGEKTSTRSATRPDSSSQRGSRTSSRQLAN